MTRIRKVVGLVSVFGLAAIAGCANPEEGSLEGEIGTVRQPLIANLAGWSVDATTPLTSLDGSLTAQATYTNNIWLGQRRVGVILVKDQLNPATCERDEDCLASGRSYCMPKPAPAAGKSCVIRIEEMVGTVITLAGGASTTVSAPPFAVGTGTFYSLAVLNKDTGYWCGDLTDRQDPTKCVRSLSAPITH